MHAVVVRVTISDQETADKGLREQVVPRTKESPGFQAGYWARKGNSGLAFLVYESEDAAQAAAEQTQSPDPDAVTIDDVEVREIVVNA